MAHLKKLDDAYKNEIIDPASAVSDREGLFQGLESRLKRELERMEARSPRPTHLSSGERVAPVRPGPAVAPAHAHRGRVEHLRGFHEQQIRNVGALDRQGELVVRLRQWLFRQGATLSPDGSIVWPKSRAELKYDTELAQQELTRIAVRGGLLYNADDKPLDTKRMVTAARGPGWCIYVMSAENHIHVSSHAVGGRHHSSLLAGGCVACAGEMQVHDGRLLVLSNKSGHYTPEPVYLTQVVRVLEQDGVEASSYKLREHLPDGTTVVEHAKASLFMATQRIPVWPADDQSGTLVANPRHDVFYAQASYPGEDYSSGFYPYSPYGAESGIQPYSVS